VRFVGCFDVEEGKKKKEIKVIATSSKSLILKTCKKHLLRIAKYLTVHVVDFE